VTHHETMSDAEWDGIYRDAWHAYYTPEHIERIGRRSAAQKNKGINLNEVTEFYLAYKLEGVHPLEGGLLRRRYRRDRRPGLPLEPALVFYPRHWARSFGNLARLAWGVWQANRLQKRIFSDPDRFAYADLATTPAEDRDHQTLALYRETTGGRGAVARGQRISEARTAVAARS
jgi:hypothetical protein